VIFFGERFSLSVVLSLIPIVLGVVICSFTEFAPMYGTLVALLSAITFVIQNLYSKRLFIEKKFEHLALVMHVSLLAFLCNIPLFLFYDIFNPEYEQINSEVREMV
jgi:drug/metabolite transporter (DMT)-like permease